MVEGGVVVVQAGVTHRQEGAQTRSCGAARIIGLDPARRVAQRIEGQGPQAQKLPVSRHADRFGRVGSDEALIGKGEAKCKGPASAIGLSEFRRHRVHHFAKGTGPGVMPEPAGEDLSWPSPLLHAFGGLIGRTVNQIATKGLQERARNLR